MNIHAFSDTLMQGRMDRLEIPIPPWIVRRRIHVKREPTSDNKNYQVLIEGRDPDNANIPFSLFKSMEISSAGKKLKQINQEPFVFRIEKSYSDEINIQFHFFGHYNEIPFNLKYSNINQIPDVDEFYLFYNPMIGKWRQTADPNDFPL